MLGRSRHPPYAARVAVCLSRSREERQLRLDAEPTDALPGSPEKVEVLCRRARLGLRLWHPRDAKDNDDAATFRRLSEALGVI